MTEFSKKICAAVLRAALEELEGSPDAEGAEGGQIAWKRRKRGDPYPCCGRKGGPHARDCDRKGKGSQGLVPKERPVKYICDGCGFKFKSRSPKIDVVCVKCRGIKISER